MRDSPTEAFTASELALALSISRREFFWCKPHSNLIIERCYGDTPGFFVSKLPEDIQLALQNARIQNGAKSLRELVRLKQQKTRRAAFFETIPFQRLAPSGDAFLCRTVMTSYFRDLDNGKFENACNRAARYRWRRLFGQSCNERTIRRIANMVDAFGGPELAPIDAYVDRKSCPHHGRPMAQNTATDSKTVSFSKEAA